MAAPIGTDMMSALVRHYVMPQVTDNVYVKNNALLFRMIRSGKRVIQGGTHIEVPVLYRRFTTGGPYRGYDIIDVAPQDTVRNVYIDWKQHSVPFAVSELDLIKADSPLAIANLLTLLGQQSYMEMGENLSFGLVQGDGLTNVKEIDGMVAVLDDSNNYAGIDRSTNAWWQATIDSGTNALTLAAMHSLFSDTTLGASHPTIWFGNGVNYNRLYALNLSTTGYGVRYNREPGGHDEVLAQAGFTNLLFENVPFVRDDTMSDTDIAALNENFLALCVSQRADFYMHDFQKPVNQNAYISNLDWAGNLMCMNSRAQGAFTALSS
jgi:hypothetical protein